MSDLGSASIDVLLRGSPAGKSPDRLAAGASDLASDTGASGLWDPEGVGGASVSSGHLDQSQEGGSDHAAPGVDVETEAATDATESSGVAEHREAFE